MPKRLLNWDQMLTDYLALFEKDVEKQSSYNDIAEQIGTQSNAITSMSVMLKAIGALSVRRDDDHHAAYYTVHLTPDEIRRRLKNRGWQIGRQSDYEAARNILQASGDIKPFARRRSRTPVTEEYPFARKVAVGTDEHGGTTAIAGEEARSPMTQLAPLRKDEPHALIEAAKAYRDRTSFIDEEIARFQARGLTISREAIGGMQPDPLMDDIIEVLPYVEQLERANDRLMQQTNNRQPSADAAALRGQITSQKAQIERLIAEKAQAGDLMADERQKHRMQLQTANREIERLNTILLNIQRAGGMNNAVKIVGGQAEAAVKDPTGAVR